MPSAALDPGRAAATPALGERDSRVVLEPHLRVADRLALPGLVLAEAAAPADLLVPLHEHSRAYVRALLEGDLWNGPEAERIDDESPPLSFHPAGSVHRSRTGPRGARTLSLEIGAEWLELVQETVPLPRASLRLERSPARAAMRRLLRELRLQDRCSGIMIEGLTLELLVAIARAGRTSRAHAGLERAVELLRDELGSTLTLRSIARDLGLPAALLGGPFRRRYGCSLGTYLRRLRVEYVLNRLPGDRPLADLALEGGFADQAHCTRVFKRLTGETPGACRARLRAGLETVSALRAKLSQRG